MTDFHVIRILLLASFSFALAMLWTPFLTHFLYKYKMGKKIRNSGETPIYTQLHAHKAGTPSMGGVLIWGTTGFITFAFSMLASFFDTPLFNDINFLSRQETLLPLGALIAVGLIGLVDDYLDATGKGMKGGGGFKMKHRLIIYTLISIVGAWWFYFKLNWTVLHVPFVGALEIGWWYIPFFIFVIVATAFSVNETDGLDGLAGGTLLICYAAYGVIAFNLERYELAVLCSVIIGSLLAFLWFNIMPARFYMGDTGAMSLGVTLGIIALLTNNALILPIIGLPFVIESMSVIIQLTSKRLRGGKKVFISSPIHHHFEAKGWPEAKIVMRFWVLSGVSAAVGLLVFMIDQSLK